MAYGSRYLQTVLDKVYTAAPSAMRAYMVTQEQAQYAIVSGGQTIQSTSANGQTVSLFEPGRGALTPMEACDVWRRLINLYDDSKAYLTGSPTEAAIKAEMMARIRHPARSISNRFDHLREAYITAN